MITKAATVNCKALHMAKPVERMKSIWGELERTGVEIAGTQETSLDMLDAVDQHEHLHVFKATPNTSIRRGRLKGSTVGNGIIVDTRAFEVQDTDQLTLRTMGRIGRKLHCPVVLLKHKSSGAQMMVLDLHLLAGSHSKVVHRFHLYNQTVIYRYLHRQGVQALVLGDLNDFSLLQTLSTVRHGIDHVQGFRGVLVTQLQLMPFIQKKLSDHEGVVANVHFELRVNQLNKLK